MKIPVVVVILNNGYLGMVRQWQELFYERRYSCTFIKGSVDFVKLAEAYGALGLRAERPSEVGPAIEEAVRSGRPTVVDVIVQCEANVYPMVPAGAAINEILDHGGTLMKHTLAVLVENKSEVLSRVASLFSRRGYNIDSLAVGVTET